MSKFGDFIALSMTKFFRFIADTFFANRYGYRAVVLETIAGVIEHGWSWHVDSFQKSSQNSF